MTSRRPISLVATIALAVSACGGGDGSGDAASRDEATPDGAADSIERPESAENTADRDSAENSGAEGLDGTTAATDTEADGSTGTGTAAETADEPPAAASAVDEATGLELPIAVPTEISTVVEAVGLDPLAFTTWSPIEVAEPAVPSTIGESITAWFADLIVNFQNDPRRVASAAVTDLRVDEAPSVNANGLLTLVADGVSFAADTWSVTAAHAEAGVRSGDPAIAAFWATRLVDANQQAATASLLANGLATVADSDPSTIHCYLNALISEGCDSPDAAALLEQLVAIQTADTTQIDDARFDAGLGSEEFCASWSDAVDRTGTGVNGFLDLWAVWDDTFFDSDYLGASDCAFVTAGLDDPINSVSADAEVLTAYTTAIADVLLAGGYTDDAYYDLGGGTDAERDLYVRYQTTLAVQAAEAAIVAATELRTQAVSPEVYALLTAVSSFSSYDLELAGFFSNLGGSYEWDDIAADACPIIEATINSYPEPGPTVIADGLSFTRLGEDFLPDC